MQERRENALAGTDAGTNGWSTRIFLQPIAPPSVLGLAGFSVATFMVASLQTKWWGTAADLRVVAPFCLTFGGIAQFLAGMWSYKARDVVATLAHGTWGAFWIAFFILELLQMTGTLPTPAAHATQLAFGLWFIGLAYTTWTAAFGAMFHSIGLFAVLSTLATGSSLSAAGLLTGGWASGWTSAGGWLFIFSAGFAWYVITAMVLMGVTGRTILPIGEFKKAKNVPGRKALRPIELEWAEPGVKQGQ
ncbi:MAG TPA: GPR1/FUN34/YaaH family transporter [Gaiellaceae bacterium]|nr:GPR1/FUN34/YaaH family transporter [Gaiellaceae bacterium]